MTLDPTGRALIVANGKGEGSPADPDLNPSRGSRDPEYVSRATVGSMRRIPIPDDATLANGIANVRGLGGPALAISIANERSAELRAARR